MIIRVICLVAVQAKCGEGCCSESFAAFQINDWLVRARDANLGDLPGLPSASEGGSKGILQEAAAAAQSVAPPAAATGTAKASGKAAQPSAKRGKDAGEPVGDCKGSNKPVRRCMPHRQMYLGLWSCAISRGSRNNPCCLNLTVYNRDEVCAADSAAATMDAMPRLACPDLMDAIKRWQQDWESRPEPGGRSTV